MRRGVTAIRWRGGAWALAAALALVCPPHAGARVDQPSAANVGRRAAMMHRWAKEFLATSTVEERQIAARDLEQIIALDPKDGEHWLLLGRIHLMGELDSEARGCFRRATVLMPREPRAWMALGRAWKRQWIRTLDPVAAVRAEGAFDTARIVRPLASEPWIALVPLRAERGDLASALDAARRAVAARPRVPEAALAFAAASVRVGDLERADSLFRAAIPKLAPDVRALLLDAPSWFRGAVRQPPRLTAAHGAMSAPDEPVDDDPHDAGARASTAATMDTAAAFWRRVDPDPTTRENEMQLEYWARVAHAYLLFWDPDRPHLDARAETYVRYGPPSKVENNPPGVPLAFAPRRSGDPRARSTLTYPMHVQGWHYPELGMRVVLNDASLHGRFTPQISRDFDPLSVPDPRILAARGDLVAFGDGVAVFPTLPPRDQRLEMRGAVLRFEGPRGPRLLAQVQAAGRPGDTLQARWIVLDAGGRELAGSDLHLGLSECDPTEWRLAELSADLPPGAASVTVSVRDPHRRRGLFRSTAALAAPTAALAISDVVLCCGDPARAAAAGQVRFEANLTGTVAGRSPLTAYFELYRLALDAGGVARFEYEYRIRRVETGRTSRRAEPPIVTSARREEEHLGALRRQFVTVPIAALAPGRYTLEIRVRDLVAGVATEGRTTFDRE